MKPREVVEHFGGIIPTAKALEVTRQAVYLWIWRKAIPIPRQYHIQIVTGGVLKATKQ